MAEDAIAGLRDEYLRGTPDGRIRLLVVFGSRARDEARASSDWDLGAVAEPGFDVESLRATLAGLLRTDHVDLVDLSRASGQLRYRVARDGVPVYTRNPGEWRSFWTDAVSFWCDAGPVLRRAYAGVLEELGP